MIETKWVIYFPDWKAWYGSESDGVVYDATQAEEYDSEAEAKRWATLRSAGTILQDANWTVYAVEGIQQ